MFKRTVKRPIIGSTRYVHKFIWWPKTLPFIGGPHKGYEMRWLCRCRVYQQCVLTIDRRPTWQDVAWVGG